METIFAMVVVATEAHPWACTAAKDVVKAAAKAGRLGADRMGVEALRVTVKEMVDSPVLEVERMVGHKAGGPRVVDMATVRVVRRAMPLVAGKRKVGAMARRKAVVRQPCTAFSAAPYPTVEAAA